MPEPVTAGGPRIGSPCPAVPSGELDGREVFFFLDNVLFEKRSFSGHPSRSASLQLGHLKAAKTLNPEPLRTMGCRPGAIKLGNLVIEAIGYRQFGTLPWCGCLLPSQVTVSSRALAMKAAHHCSPLNVHEASATDRALVGGRPRGHPGMAIKIAG